jgi:hypothetical protein
MNVNYKKVLRMAVLLVISLLIASVSAATYYTMFMDATVGIAGNEVTFTPGLDWGSSTMGGGNQSVSLGLAGDAGANTTISDPVRILNSGSGDYDLNLQLDTWDGEAETDLNYIRVTIFNDVSGGTAEGATIELVPGGADVTETGTVTIGATTTWRVAWIIYWKDTATTETVTVNLKLDVS